MNCYIDIMYTMRRFPTTNNIQWIDQKWFCVKMEDTQTHHLEFRYNIYIINFYSRYQNIMLFFDQSVPTFLYNNII